MFSVSPAHTIDILAAESGFHFAFEQDKGLFEVMPMQWRAATWRDMHINYAEASCGLLACHAHGVGVADQTDVREVVGLHRCEIALSVRRAPQGRQELARAALRFARVLQES